MARISKRFYANRATQRHQLLDVEFDGFYSDNIGGTVEFMVKSQDGYMRVSLSSTEAMRIAQKLMRFATIVGVSEVSE
jgi:hypothetical protein